MTSTKDARRLNRNPDLTAPKLQVWSVTTWPPQQCSHHSAYTTGTTTATVNFAADEGFLCDSANEFWWRIKETHRTVHVSCLCIIPDRWWC